MATAPSSRVGNLHAKRFSEGFLEDVLLRVYTEKGFSEEVPRRGLPEGAQNALLESTAPPRRVPYIDNCATKLSLRSGFDTYDLYSCTVYSTTLASVVQLPCLPI